MAHRPPPSIHDIEPSDIDVVVIADQQLHVNFLQADSTLPAGSIHIAGNSDRERLNNLLEIAQRMRTAALDLLAALHNEPGASTYSATGAPPSFPEAAPLHGTTVTRVRAS